jgi:hypothetical protein
VLVGTTPKMLDVDQLRRAARHMTADVLIGVQGNRLVLVIGRAHPTTTDSEDSSGPPMLSFMEIAVQLEPNFGQGHLVLGHEVPNLVDASKSAKAALAGFAVARSWRNAPRPVQADDLLPERALAGDPLARATLIHRIYRPLQAHSTELLTTLWCYLDNGRSLEATAREALRAPEYRSLSPEARLRGDRVRRHRRPRGTHPAGRAHHRVHQRPRRIHPPSLGRLRGRKVSVPGLRKDTLRPLTVSAGPLEPFAVTVSTNESGILGAWSTLRDQIVRAL